MKFPRILQVVLCLVLCCTLVFSMATPKVQAVAIVDDIGYIIWMILAAAGIVFPASNVAQIEGLGTSFTGFMDSEVGTEEEKSAWEEWCTAIGNILSSDDRPADPRLAIPDVLLDLFVLFSVKGAVDGYDVFTDLESGFLFYNGLLFPDYRSIFYSYTDSPLMLIYLNGDNVYLRFFDSSLGSFYWDELGGKSFRFTGSTTTAVMTYVESGTSWDTSGNSKSVYNSYDSILWSNFDILKNGSVYMAGTDASSSSSEVILPAALVGGLSDVTDPEEITTDDIVIPTTFDPSWLWDDNKTKDDVVAGVAADLISGSLTHADYLTLVQSDAYTGSEDDILYPGSLGELKADTFWETLADILMTPFEWIFGMLESLLESLFVPDAAYISTKIDALSSEFSFAHSIIETGELFGDRLQNITTTPPVVYIDLGATEGPYDIGGNMAFVDLSWYEKYKPSGDALISAFMWAIFAWRIFQKLPGIISGASGDFVMLYSFENNSSGGSSRKKKHDASGN